MPQNNTRFVYKYSAKENQEILEIRKKYLPESETAYDELIRLDRTVQMSGTVEALCAGVLGTFVLGVGMCLAMQVIAQGVWAHLMGIVIGLVGLAVMLAAYPIYRKVYYKTKEKLAPRILELTESFSVAE